MEPSVNSKGMGSLGDENNSTAQLNFDNRPTPILIQSSGQWEYNNVTVEQYLRIASQVDNHQLRQVKMPEREIDKYTRPETLSGLKREVRLGTIEQREVADVVRQLLDEAGRVVSARQEIADHTEEAERDCVEDFILTCLFPVVSQKESHLTVGRLRDMAQEHKKKWYDAHPNDLKRNLSLIASAQDKLLFMELRSRVHGETLPRPLSELIKTSLDKLDELIAVDKHLLLD
jgi:hypothetical protein